VEAQAGKRPRLANEACVTAASSPELRELNGNFLRVFRNIVDLIGGLRGLGDWEPGYGLSEAARELGDNAEWVSELGVIAAFMESQKDQEYTRMVLGMKAPYVATRISLTIKQINLALSSIRNPALVAEGRTLRDAADRFEELLKPCMDQSLSR
jgi:hypothetical protein